MYCPSCQKNVKNPAEGERCPACGTKLWKNAPKPGRHFCLQCNSQFDKTRTVTPGSFAIELFLWLLLLVPGLIYSIWRLTARHQACPVCGAKTLVPSTSPAAQRFLGTSSAPLE
jgi:ssDNA-binding Zn-finger/Zn-ribbon topoisomerase 1